MNKPKTFLVIIFTFLLASAIVSAQEISVADKLAEALKLYGETEFDKGITTANECLKQANLTSRDSIAIYEVLSIITYAKGEEHLKTAFGYLDKISKLGPCVIPLPHEIWPQELRDKWYQILKAKDALSCPSEGDGKIQTIAIMEFDNFSIGKYQEQLGALSKGLADFFEHDFRKISALKVVERDKIDFVLKELELQKSGQVDQATAAKIGKILGAQIMVFGSITQLDDNNSRMIVRAVKVETSEIIASVDKQGKPEYSKMEKELVEDLAKQLNIQINDQTKSLLMEGGTDSFDATTVYSKGLDYMDKYDYRNAYECFKKAFELDKTFAEAKRKMEIYRPLAG
jgi:tetratricopeptide (TPR) repeat protein